jgi:hypothetical protein
MDDLVKAIDRVMSISTPVMGGDNLAIVICSHFDDGEDGDDDCGWSPSAVAAYEEIKAAIEFHFKPAADALTALQARIAALTAERDAARGAALEEAAKVATGFLVGDPQNGVPLRNPMAHEIATAIRALKEPQQ